MARPCSKPLSKENSSRMSTRWLPLGITSSTSTLTIVASDRPWMKTRPRVLAIWRPSICMLIKACSSYSRLVLLLIFHSSRPRQSRASLPAPSSSSDATVRSLRSTSAIVTTSLPSCSAMALMRLSIRRCPRVFSSAPHHTP